MLSPAYLFVPLLQEWKRSLPSLAAAAAAAVESIGEGERFAGEQGTRGGGTPITGVSSMGTYDEDGDGSMADQPGMELCRWECQWG